MIIVSTGCNLACAIYATTCPPSCDGVCAVGLFRTAMFCVIVNTNVTIQVHIIDAGLDKAGAVLTNTGFPAGN